MINLEFVMPDGSRVMAYDVRPACQAEPVAVPAGATGVTVWLGTRSVDPAGEPDRRRPRRC
jgi:hypothetical protein